MGDVYEAVGMYEVDQAKCNVFTVTARWAIMGGIQGYQKCLTNYSITELTLLDIFFVLKTWVSLLVRNWAYGFEDAATTPIKQSSP